MKPECFLLDVDGVMTTGQFLYSSEGKLFKIFGPDDNDALKVLNEHLEISFVTADKKGLAISEKRIVQDMGYRLNLVGSIERASWIKENYKADSVIYMGDGIFDGLTMKEVGYSIAPANADRNAKSLANFVTQRKGGDRAVAEACLHILNKFFNINSTNIPLIKDIK